jgi:hypothetical protein
MEEQRGDHAFPGKGIGKTIFKKNSPIFSCNRLQKETSIEGNDTDNRRKLHAYQANYAHESFLSITPSKQRGNWAL